MSAAARIALPADVLASLTLFAFETLAWHVTRLPQWPSMNARRSISLWS
jgi:hypothetical protein